MKILRLSLAAILAALCLTCARSPETAVQPIRLVDLFKPELVSGGTQSSDRAIPRTEWRFDGAGP